ncbi:endonuclease NucS domain-containing protein [Mesorhizobium sp. KR2-14]|uniref:endonuclease NucS domain-containing protein n=1 Tax=Mesorhizobium sp. KR2-14 TaxID=3156610 RepID=UPI0032B4DFA0
MAIYDQPTKTLMREFVKDLQLTPDQVFDKNTAVKWFASKYPKLKRGTVTAHVEGMAVNASSRIHHPAIRPGSGYDLFFKVAPGRFRLWNEEKDPAPIYRDMAPGTQPSIDDDAEEVEVEASREFAYEHNLRDYLARNLHLIEPGLKLYRDEGFEGVEFPVGGRFIDILAVDSKDNFVVVELKVSRGYDRVVGQLLRYMAWVQKELASEPNSVRGVIIASQMTEDLQLAASLMPNVQLMEYELALTLRPVVS